MKYIPGYETRYSITKDGRVYSHLSSKWLSYREDKDGYPIAYLYDYLGKCKTCKVHQLVLVAYIGPRPHSRYQVNHKNGIRNDNRLGNLEWCSPEHNMSERFRIGLTSHKGELAPNAKLTNSQADRIRELHSQRNLTHKELASLFNVSRQTIGNVLNNTTFRR